MREYGSVSIAQEAFPCGSLLPSLPRRITRIAGGLSLGLARRSSGSGLDRIVRRFSFCLGLLRGRLLGLGLFPALPGRRAFGGELLVDRRPRFILVQQLLLRLRGLAGAVLECAVVGHVEIVS